MEIVRIQKYKTNTTVHIPKSIREEVDWVKKGEKVIMKTTKDGDILIQKIRE